MVSDIFIKTAVQFLDNYYTGCHTFPSSVTLYKNELKVLAYK
jgi:hypothetical protein